MTTLLVAVQRYPAVAATTTARIDDLSGWRNLVFNIGQPLAMWCHRFAFGYHCLSGFSFVIPGSIYEAAGGFDSALNADEDADLSRRVAASGGIRLLHHPVTMSGRCNRNGMLRGAFAYFSLILSFACTGRGHTWLMCGEFSHSVTSRPTCSERTHQAR